MKCVLSKSLDMVKYLQTSFHSSIPQFNPKYYLDSHTFWPDLYWPDGQLMIIMWASQSIYHRKISDQLDTGIKIKKLFLPFKSGFINLRIIYFMQENYCQLKIRPYKRTRKKGWSLR